MNDPVDHPALEFRISRLNAVERAQGRYIYLLVLVGLFYWALDRQFSRDGYDPDALVGLPIFTTVELPTKELWTSAPIVLSILVSAVLGSILATRDAAAEVKRAAKIRSEEELPIELDPHPTIIDFVVFTREATPGWVKTALYFSYPVVLLPFYGLAVWLWWKMFDRGLASWWYLAPSAFVLVTPLPRLVPWVWRHTPLPHVWGSLRRRFDKARGNEESPDAPDVPRA
jgi:hypothetical protein